GRASYLLNGCASFNRPRPRPRLPLGWRDRAGWFHRLQFLDCRPPLAATLKDRLRGRGRSEDPNKRIVETCHAGSRRSASIPRASADHVKASRLSGPQRKSCNELEIRRPHRYVKLQPSPIRECRPAHMSYGNASLKQRSFGKTMRRGAWWAQPLFVFLGLSTFLVYSTWAAFQGTHYWLDQNGANYLSPFYSPEIFGSSPHAFFGSKPAWWPSWLLFSPALLVLWAPAGFRLTCYYYRGAYYKAFWADPPACAVGEPRKGYPGENSFPLIMQNIHRYFLYLALLFILVLAH